MASVVVVDEELFFTPNANVTVCQDPNFERVVPDVEGEVDEDTVALG